MGMVAGAELQETVLAQGTIQPAIFRRVSQSPRPIANCQGRLANRPLLPRFPGIRTRRFRMSSDSADGAASPARSAIACDQSSTPARTSSVRRVSCSHVASSSASTSAIHPKPAKLLLPDVSNCSQNRRASSSSSCSGWPCCRRRPRSSPAADRRSAAASSTGPRDSACEPLQEPPRRPAPPQRQQQRDLAELVGRFLGPEVSRP